MRAQDDQVLRSRATAGSPRAPRRQVGAAAKALALAAAVAMALAALVAGPAAADTAPIDPASPSSPPTVSADGLPTAQIDGVAWQQVVVGNIVYVAGNFQTARPAGAAPGTSTVPRKNILAYDIRTGNLVTGFAPSLNAQALAIAASPDGSRIYVGGQFTQVNGVNAYRIAALNPATGALITSFQPAPNATVTSIVATAATVYAGGWFSGVGSTARANLAAFRAGDGGLLPWNPASTGGTVNAMAISPDLSKLVVGGSFTALNGSANPGYGMGIVDATTGALKPFPANTLIRNAGTKAAILSLATGNNQIYGTGYVFGAGGNLEGTFSANWSDGAIKWVEDCHGDTYSAYPGGSSVYVAGHPHYCGTVGGFPQTSPAWEFHRGLAFSEAATGTLGTNPYGGYYNFAGTPAPTLLNWFPDMDQGTFTGESQGPWTVQGNSDYVAYGGEFLHVNGVAQQGLVRYAKAALAPNKQGPMVAGSAFNPTIKSIASGTALITWLQNWDRDNATLRYDVIRDGDTSNPVFTASSTNTFWTRASRSFMDTGLVPGSTHGYRVFATDAFGNQVRSDTVNITVSSTGTLGKYAAAVYTDGAANYWRLGEASGTTVVDWAGTSNLTAGSGVTRGAAGAVVGDADKASTFNGTTSGLAATATSVAGPNVFSAEAWFKTTTTRGGKILGFGSAKTGSSSSYDRHIYMANNGTLVYGVYPGSAQTLATTAKYNDGAWHHVVATLSPGGMALYVDGSSVGQRAAVTSGQAYNGYWRVGGDALSSWPSAPTSNYFAGVIDEVAIYPAALSAAAIASHYAKGTNTVVNQPPVAAFTATPSKLVVAFTGAASSDTDGSIASYGWDWGDGTAAGTGATPQHTYAAAGTYQVKLTVTDNQGATNVLTKAVTVVANQPPVAAFTATPSNLVVAFTGAASSDPDGSIASYGWDWGDGTAAGTGATPQHTYAAAGTYQVKLTVTDNQGATNVLTKAVTVVAAPAGVVASDAFARTVSNGLGNADVGGPWSYDTGRASAYSVAGGGANVINGPGLQPNLGLNGVSATSTDTTLMYSLNNIPGGGGMYVSVQGRTVGGSNDYRAKLAMYPDGTVGLMISRYVNGAEAILTGTTVQGLSYAAGTKLHVRLVVTGTSPTTINAKVWKDGSPEPAAWQVGTTDATAALQAAGGVGMLSYLSGGAAGPTTVKYEALLVQPAQ